MSRTACDAEIRKTGKVQPRTTSVLNERESFIDNKYMISYGCEYLFAIIFNRLHIKFNRFYIELYQNETQPSHVL